MGSTTEALETWLEDFVDHESEAPMVERWVGGVADTILAETPEIADDAAVIRLLRESVKAHWLSFLSELTASSEEIRLVRPAEEFATLLAQRQLHLATLFKVYRIAQQAVWRYVTEVVRTPSSHQVDDTEVLVAVWSRASAWIDASVAASVDVYQRERDRIRQGAAAERLEWVRRALDGTVLDTREFSARIGGYPVSGFNTAFVLHAGDNDAVGDLEQVGTRLARLLDATQPLLISPGGHELWGWAGTRGRPDLEVLAEFEEQLRGGEVAAYVGTPALGIDGFAISHREAQTAGRIVAESHTPRPLTRFPDVELVALISQSGEAATRFATRTLGDLAAPTETAQRLRETLLALLTTGSVEAAARHLVVHKNTVRYRVTQAEEILGRPVIDTQVELALALRYHEAFLATEPM